MTSKRLRKNKTNYLSPKNINENNEKNKLSMEEKIGQRFIFGVNDNDIEPILELIKKSYIGGVVLYKKNYNSYDEMLKDCQTTIESPQTGIDYGYIILPLGILSLVGITRFAKKNTKIYKI